MGRIAIFFTSVFSGLFSIIGGFVGKKVAYGAAVSATLLIVAITFYTAINGLLSGVIQTMSNTTFLMVFYSVLPSNFATCITVMLTSDVAGFIYRHQVATIKSVASV
jgi:hypothetical protein